MPVTLTGSRWKNGRLQFFEKANPDRVIFQLDAASRDVEVFSADKTLDAQDTGKLLMMDTDAKTFTLPSTAAGITYTIINIAEDGAAKLSISPAAADKIQGPDIAGVDNKDLINTKATQKQGDMVVLVGGADGWFVAAISGTWAAEA